MKKILLLAETNWLERVPEYSFYEADGSLHRKLLERVELLDKSMGSLKKIGESEHCAALCKQAREIIKQLKTISFNDRYAIQPVLDEIKSVVQVIPYTKSASIKAELRFKSSKPPFKEDDCRILESILEYVESVKENYNNIIFYTADKEDFDYDLIRDELSGKGIEIRFDSKLCVKKIME